jgi:hypothetical protein
MAKIHSFAFKNICLIKTCSKMKICHLIIIIVYISLVGCQMPVKKAEPIQFQSPYEFDSVILNKVETDTMPWKYQISAAEFASKGDYYNALLHWDLGMGMRNNSFTEIQVDSINNLYEKVPAKTYIVNRAKSHQIVIINEAHHNSYHRFFTKSLLMDLYKNGYRNLGLEALSNDANKDLLLNKRKYPIQSSGWYIKDPQFGELVRVALELGYNVFPYEQTSGVNGKQREEEQAKNIQQVIDSHPDEKFLIHCGFDHVLEGKHQSWEKAMAGRLKEYTGIDPLTIHQVAYSEKSDPIYNHPLLKAIAPSQPTVLLDREKNPYQYIRGENYTDIAVFHPNSNRTHDRPNWLYSNSYEETSIELNEIEMTFPIMVMAYAKSESIENTIPSDIVEIKEKIDSCMLALKKGAYYIVITNGDKSIVTEKQI